MNVLKVRRYILWGVLAVLAAIIIYRIGFYVPSPIVP